MCSFDVAFKQTADMNSSHIFSWNRKKRRIQHWNLEHCWADVNCTVSKNTPYMIYRIYSYTTLYPKSDAHGFGHFSIHLVYVSQLNVWTDSVCMSKPISIKQQSTHSASPMFELPGNWALSWVCFTVDHMKNKQSPAVSISIFDAWRRHQALALQL